VEITGIGELERISGDADLKRLYLYWCERRGTRLYPARDDIDPVDFSYALGRVSLVEVQGKRFYYRLVSTQLTQHLGYEMTGKFLDQMPGSEMRNFAEQHYRRALACAAPLYETDAVVLDGRRWRHESLVLPLAADGETISMLLIYRTTGVPEPVHPERR